MSAAIVCGDSHDVNTIALHHAMSLIASAESWIRWDFTPALRLQTNKDAVNAEPLGRPDAYHDKTPHIR